MKIKSYLLIAGLTACVATTAAAQVNNLNNNDRSGRFYIGAQGGMNFLHNKTLSKTITVDGSDYHSSVKNGFLLGGDLGYQFTRNLSADLSVDYMRNKIAIKEEPANAPKLNINQTNVMINGNYAFAINSFSPYVSAGFGVSHIGFSIPHYFSDSTNALAWQVGAGVKYKVLENVDLGVGYRLLGNHKEDFNTYNNSVLASVNFYLPAMS